MSIRQHYTRLSTLIAAMSVSFVTANALGAQPDWPEAKQLSTDANGQLLVREEGEITATASFVFYRTAKGTLCALSAGHCIESNATYVGVWHDNPVKMYFVYADTNADFSVFVVPETSTKYLIPETIAAETDTNKNAPVITAGSFRHRWCPVIVNGEYKRTTDEGWAIYDMPGVTHGYSGAGVFDPSEHLVGIVIGVLASNDELTGMAFVEPISSIITSLRDHGQIDFLPEKRP